MTSTRPDAGSIRASVAVVRSEIEAACRRAGRRPQEVRVVAASKTVPVEVLREAWEAGIRDFGENRAAELSAKEPALCEATWHFIGRLQSGTARDVADHAGWIHSGEPGHALARIATRINARGRSVAVLAQVDFTGRRQGVSPEAVEGFLDQAEPLDGVRMVGLMTMPPWSDDPEAARPYFARLRELRDRLRERHPGLNELSMGMSGDFPIAVEEGATMVRVGTALFGARTPVGSAGAGQAPTGR